MAPINPTAFVRKGKKKGAKPSPPKARRDEPTNPTAFAREGQKGEHIHDVKEIVYEIHTLLTKISRRLDALENAD